MGKKLVITLDEDTTQKYLERAQALLIGEVELDCEPGGLSIRVDIAPRHYPTTIWVNGKDIGEATVAIVGE